MLTDSTHGEHPEPVVSGVWRYPKGVGKLEWFARVVVVKGGTVSEKGEAGGWIR